MLERRSKLREKLDQVDRELKTCETRWRDIIAKSRHGVLTVDAKSAIRFANQVAASIFGCRVEELVGREFEMPAVTDKPVELNLNSRDGRAVPVEIWMVETEWSGEPAWFVTIHDMTERKKLEEALLLSEARYRALFCDNPTMIITLDAELKMLSANPACASQLGYATDELEGETVLKLFHEGDRHTVSEQLRLGLQNPDQVFQWQFRMLRKDGGMVWVEELVRAVSGPHGMSNVLIVCQDITLRKQAEEEIEKLNTDLAARAVELESANRELEAFSSTVSHDLRNPLTVINGYCQAIMEQCGDQLGAQCREYVEESYKGTLRMNRLIDALLEFSRLTCREVKPETVDLSALAMDVAAELKSAEPERSMSFAIAEGVAAKGDPALLRVVLANLLGNACKYTSQLEEAIIDFGVTEKNGKRAYFVRDNGLGFEMDNAAEMFLPFRRLPGVEEFSGHGVGLATVERIIRRHGGSVWAEGAPGKGATFYFTL